MSAHFGHWYVSMLYVAPVAAIVGALTYLSWRDKRRARAAERAERRGPTVP